MSSARSPPPTHPWIDLLSVALLAGIGFTVSLLIGGLAFGSDSDRGEHVEAGVLAGRVIAAALASLVLIPATGSTGDSIEAESRDDDHDGILNVYQPALRPEEGRNAHGDGGDHRVRPDDEGKSPHQERPKT